jgi:hypothetical protein
VDGSAAETRAAVRSLARIAMSAVALYLLVGLGMTRDGWLTRLGRESELEFALARADGLDRSARWGDRPIVFVVGSSITRDAIDEERLRLALLAGGFDAGVEKYGFASGAPVYTRAFTRGLSLRPGDRVVTSVACDNFREEWLALHDGTREYLQVLTSPRELFQIAGLSMHERAEYALASVPPASYWRYGASFRRGAELALAGLARGELPTPRAHHGNEPYDPHVVRDGFREVQDKRRSLTTADNLSFAAGQPNWDAIGGWADDVTSRGAEAWVFEVPHHPEYYDRLITEDGAAECRGALPSLSRFRRLSERPGVEYLDYKHPNVLGRRVFTHEVAAWLLGAP